MTRAKFELRAVCTQSQMPSVSTFAVYFSNKVSLLPLSLLGSNPPTLAPPTLSSGNLKLYCHFLGGGGNADILPLGFCSTVSSSWNKQPSYLSLEVHSSILPSLKGHRTATPSISTKRQESVNSVGI